MNDFTRKLKQLMAKSDILTVFGEMCHDAPVLAAVVILALAVGVSLFGSMLLMLVVKLPLVTCGILLVLGGLYRVVRVVGDVYVSEE